MKLFLMILGALCVLCTAALAVFAFVNYEGKRKAENAEKTAAARAVRHMKVSPNGQAQPNEPELETKAEKGGEDNEMV